MGLFGKKKPKEEEVDTIIESSLMILMESPKSGVVQYFNSVGIKVESLMYSLEDLRYALMDMCEYHRRLVIIENGLGVFSKQENREALVDILSMVNNIALDATLVYTDSGMASYIRKQLKDLAKETGSEAAKIDYIQFESMMTVYKALSKYNEKYVVGGADAEEEPDAMNLVAPKVEVKNNYYLKEFKDASIIEEFRNENTETEVSLNQYQIKL